MGQYYYVVNIDKKQYLNPHKFGDGLKLLEFGSSAEGTLTGLAILLASGNGRGGGDLHGPVCTKCRRYVACKGPGGGYTSGPGMKAPTDCPHCDYGFRRVSEIVGSWAGDRIVIAGDYGDPGLFVPGEAPAEGEDTRPNLHEYAIQNYRDISADVVLAMADDPRLRESLGTARFGGTSALAQARASKKKRSKKLQQAPAA